MRRAFMIAGWTGLALVALIVTLGDFLARFPAGHLHAGPPLAPPSALFPFGTDVLGRDVWSETVHALDVTVANSAGAAVLALLFGGVSGFVSTRLGAVPRLLLRWTMGVLASAPALLLAIVLIGLTARGYAGAAAGLAAAPLAFVRAFDRARSEMGERRSEYARATGISAGTLIRRDFVYEFRGALLLTAARSLAAVAIVYSTVSFLGFGAEPPRRDLGLMMAAAQASYLTAWWTAAFPALFLIALILLARLAAGLDEGERA
jgi:peptide/nickel transport system permease protein